MPFTVRTVKEEVSICADGGASAGDCGGTDSRLLIDDICETTKAVIAVWSRVSLLNGEICQGCT